MYFNYHAKVKRLILEGQAKGYEFVQSYKDISPCLLIHMKDGKAYPIRQHKFVEYLYLLDMNGITMIEKRMD